MKRFEDWPLRLESAVEEAREKKFKWGDMDCALFAADVVLSMTGQDLAADFRGTYSTAIEANRVVRERGGLIKIATEALGESVSVARAKRGDVVLKPAETWPSLGICLGAISAFTGLSGLVFVKTRECSMAWRV